MVRLLANMLSAASAACWPVPLCCWQILTGIQELLENPNVDDPAQEEAWNSLKHKPSDYRRRVRHQVTARC